MKGMQIKPIGFVCDECVTDSHAQLSSLWVASAPVCDLLYVFSPRRRSHLAIQEDASGKPFGAEET